MVEAGKKTDNGNHSPLSDWIKALTAFWGHPGLQAAWQTGGDGLSEESEAPLARMWSSWFKNLHLMAGVMTSPETLQAAMQAYRITPEVMAQFTQSTFSAFTRFQTQFEARLQRADASMKPIDLQHLDKEALHLWTEAYEQDIRPFFNLPQFGLLREHQERTMALADRSCRFQAVLAEFLQMLSTPFAKALKTLQDQVQRQALEGRLADDPRSYYREWIKILEGHFMVLFKTSEYTTALTRTMNALGDFLTARREVMQDILTFMDMPGRMELDELYKEQHELKKEIKALKRAVAGAL